MMFLKDNLKPAVKRGDIIEVFRPSVLHKYIIVSICDYDIVEVINISDSSTSNICLNEHTYSVIGSILDCVVLPTKVYSKDNNSDLYTSGALYSYDNTFYINIAGNDFFDVSCAKAFRVTPETKMSYVCQGKHIIILPKKILEECE